MSGLRRALESYLAIKNALGSKRQAHERLLRSFVEFAEAKGASPITAQVALDWACSSSGPQCGSARASRLTVARLFLTYLSSIEPATQIPSAHLLAAPRRSPPFLFSVHELGLLIQAADRLGPRDSLRPHTMATVIGVLASAGLRPSEVLQLTVADVQLRHAPPRLLIRESKFHKSRLVPLDVTVAERLQRYADLRAQQGYDGLSDAFFVSEQGGHLSYAALNRAFHGLLATAGIPARTGCRAATLRCIRHSFAVNRIVAWLEQGIDVRRQLPNLSVYLGHVNVAASYWYLTATPEMLVHAGTSFATAAGREGEQ